MSICVGRGPGRAVIVRPALYVGGLVELSRIRWVLSIGGAGLAMCGAAIAISESSGVGPLGHAFSTWPALTPSTT
jgi:hypothetical protein